MNFEGKNAVFELLNSDKTVEKVIFENKAFDDKLHQIFELAKSKGIKTENAAKKQLDKLSETGKHQGVIAVASDFVYGDLDEVIANARNKGEQILLVLLDGVLDPHNLGSVLRVAECVSATAVVIPKNRSAVVNETVVRVSAGAAAYVPVCKVSNLASTIEGLKQNNIWVYSCDMQGDTMYNTDLVGDVAIVVGGEGQGVSALVNKKCDKIISIPMFGKINSLNASVSAGIVLYEVTRQRLQKQGKNT